MKLQKSYFIIWNLFIGAIGIICIFIGVTFGGSLGRPFWESVGIGLLAACLVNLLDRVLILEPPPVPIQRIEVVSEKRVNLPESIIGLKYNARKVDIVGVSLNHFLKELVNDPKQILITRLLKYNLQLRIFFIHPASKYLKQRAFEDNQDIVRLIETQKEAVELCAEFYKQLQKVYDALSQTGMLDEHLIGSLQIILLDCCPYVTIYRVDDEIYWGLYTAGASGVNLPLFKTSMNLDPAFYSQLHEHIHSFMVHEDIYPKLVHMPEMKKPALNRKVLQDALQ